MSFQTILTNLGLAKVAAAIADGVDVTLTTMVFGDGNGNPTTPVATQTALVRQVHSSALNRLQVTTGSRYVAEAVIPASTGGWAIREVGLRDASGALFAVANFPEIYKPTAAEGATRDLVVRLEFEVVNAADVTLIIDPSVVLATRSWVEGNFDLVALLPGGTTGQVLRKRSNADGDVEWYDPFSASTIIVDIVQEEQTLAAAQTAVTLTTTTTEGLAIYIEGVRLHPTDYSVTGIGTLTLATSYPAGSKILFVQNDPAGDLTYLRAASNLADVANKQAGRANLGFPNATDGAFMETLWRSLMAFQYPVGEILTTRRTGSPATWLGFGTWERYGAGRVMVSMDPLDPSFQTLDQTGGAKSHVLSIGEIPAHSHVVDPPSTATTSAGAHIHDVAADNGTDLRWVSLSGTGPTVNGPTISGGSPANRAAMQTTSSGAHTHVLDIAPFSSDSTGANQGHNNLQPYIVVNVWRRTA